MNPGGNTVREPCKTMAGKEKRNGVISCLVQCD